MSKALLEVSNLRTYFGIGRRTVRAVDGLDLTVHKGESLGIVGESGSGKSVTARSILRLVDAPGRIEGGEVLFQGVDLVRLSEQDVNKIRGRHIGMIFQDPIMSLDPLLPLGRQLVEGLQWHFQLERSTALDRAEEYLSKAKVPSPRGILAAYPHQLSGGMCQRVAIAMALSLQPDLLIADEPTSSLDVTIQAQILELLLELRQQLGMSIILISHDLAVISKVCDRTAIMYAGKVVEQGPTEAILKDPKHPYTQGLLASIPKPDMGSRLPTPIPGEPPRADRLSSGCTFAPRCSKALPVCVQGPPPWKQRGADQFARCVLED